MLDLSLGLLRALDTYWKPRVHLYQVNGVRGPAPFPKEVDPASWGAQLIPNSAFATHLAVTAAELVCAIWPVCFETKPIGGENYDDYFDLLRIT